jgi:hypothetical protein
MLIRLIPPSAAATRAAQTSTWANLAAVNAPRKGATSLRNTFGGLSPAYVNQRMVLARRAALVELLYTDPVPEGVIVAG